MVKGHNMADLAFRMILRRIAAVDLADGPEPHHDDPLISKLLPSRPRGQLDHATT